MVIALLLTPVVKTKHLGYAVSLPFLQRFNLCPPLSNYLWRATQACERLHEPVLLPRSD